MYDKPYITYVGRQLAVVRCKGDCSTVLVQRRGVAQNLRVDKTNAYSELVIEMLVDYGNLGQHETAVCKKCRERILTGGLRVGELQSIYDQDIIQWIASATVAARPRLMRINAQTRAARFAGFKPLRALEDRGRGDTAYMGI